MFYQQFCDKLSATKTHGAICKPEGCSKNQNFPGRSALFGKSVQICAQITNCTSKNYIHKEVHFFPENFRFWNSLLLVILKTYTLQTQYQQPQYFRRANCSAIIESCPIHCSHSGCIERERERERDGKKAPQSPRY